MPPEKVLAVLVSMLEAPWGPFHFKARLPVNNCAQVYVVWAIVNMAWPRTPDAPWFINYAMVLSTAIVIGLGLLYMWLGKPYDHGTAPSGDAWKVSR